MARSKLPQKPVAQESWQTDMVSADDFRKRFRIADHEFIYRKFEAFRAALPRDSREVVYDQQAAMVEAIEYYDGLAPVDAVERMLAKQIVVSHMMAMFFMERANRSLNEKDMRQLDIKHGHAFMNMFLKQQAALEKYRNKGQQRIIVEKVQVANGGQAIVGNVAVGKQPDQAVSTSGPRKITPAAPMREDSDPFGHNDRPFGGLV